MALSSLIFEWVNKTSAMKHLKLSFDDHQSSSLKYPLSILADNITLSKNIGALFRLCDSLGVEHLYLSGKTSSTPDAKRSKVSRSTEKSVAHSVNVDALQTIGRLKNNGYSIISLEITKHSKSLREFDFNTEEKICLILGDEAKGVSDELLAASDHCIHIPMLGMNSSMNVINAASIAVFEITKDLSRA